MPSPKARQLKPRPAKAAAAPVSLQQLVIDALDDLKAQDLVCLDLSNKASFADTMIIATGTSTRHVASLADAAATALRKSGHPPLGVEAADEWCCVDAGDLVIHIFTPTSREHYKLEKLWSFPAHA